MTRSSSPLFELQGTWLQNAGARQMLDAAVSRFRGHDPEVRLAIDPCWGSFGDRRNLGLLQIVPRRLGRGAVLEQVTHVLHLLARGAFDRLCDEYGLIERRNVDGLVDISGFALSDQWGAEKAAHRCRVVEAYKRRGKPVVLLPQSMGPFEDPEIAATSRRILTSSDLVWVRDRQSLDYVHRLVGRLPSVRTAPDITIGGPAERPLEPTGQVVMVPNARIVDHGAWTRDEYLGGLIAAGEAAHTAGRSLEVLLHTTERGDEELARVLGTELRCPVVRDQHPAAMKGRLGAAELVIASRFHAVLGALSLGTPAVAIGWSHKYRELFVDFGVDDFGLAVTDRAMLDSTIGALLRDSSTVRCRLADRVPVLRREVEMMWDQSLAVLHA